MRIVRLANYVAPASGGLRTALRELGAGYLAAGHEPVLVIPGPPPAAPPAGRAGARAARGVRPDHTALDRPLGRGP